MQRPKSVQPFIAVTWMKKECSAESYVFGQQNRHPVVTDFSDGQITSSCRLILIAEVYRYYHISERFADYFSDQRDSNRVQHQLQG